MFDAIVIGVGAMGSAACHHLARRGAKVLGLERFGIPHGLGSSGGQTRLIRLAYYEHPDYVPLLRRAYALWDELRDASGEKLLFRTGGLYLGPPGSAFVDGSLRSAEQHRLPHELLDRRGIAARYPQFQVPDDFAALYEPEAGFVLSERAIAVHARLAERNGAVIRADEPVRHWSADQHGVTVQTDRGAYHAGRVIFTAGAWTEKLVRDLEVPLSVTRQVLGWVAPPPLSFTPGRWPCWAIEHNDAHGLGLLYGFPVLEGEDAMKVAYHHRGPAADPDALDRAPRTADENDFRPLLRRYIPTADGPIRRTHVCMYTYSPDGHFVVDHHPVHSRVTVACGFSGHGYKFAPVIGEALADLALNGTTELPIGFLGLRRFA